MDDSLLIGEFSDRLAVARKKAKDIDYVISQLGDLSSPPPEVIKYIVKECTNIEERTAFLFFVRAFGWMPHPTKSKIKMSQSMYDWQLVAAMQYLSGTKFISKKVRQVGATTFTSIYFLWRSLFYSNTVEYILSLGVRESSEVLSRVTFMYENLPSWLKTPMLEGAKTSITFRNSSKIKALPGTPDATRGSSLSCALVDEFAFLKKADGILSAVVPALSMGFLTPFSNSSLPSQLFIISTFPIVENENNEYVRLYKEAIQREGDFEIITVTTDDIPEYQDQQWHKNMLTTLGPKKYNVEILGQMNSTMDNSFIAEHVLSKLEAKHPIRTDFLRPSDVDEEGFAKDMNALIGARENYDPAIGYIKNLWVFSDPIPGKTYGITVDLSTGTGGDYSAIHVFDISNQEQVAEFRSNRVSLEDIKLIIKDITDYYNKALLSIERNSIGAAICDYFYETLNYENLYMYKKSKNAFLPGFPVTAGNRGSICASMSAMLGTESIKINSIRTINELRSFGYMANGRLAGIGSSDDLVMSLAQYCYLCESFFTSGPEEIYSKEFLDNVKAEEDSIRRRHYGNVNDYYDERLNELGAITQGYSINPEEYKKWKENLA